MSRQTWQEAIAWATASGTAIASSVTETILFSNITIPANYLSDGRVLRLRFYGGYGTTATPTLAFALRWGGVAGTVLAKSGAITTGSGVGGGASMTALWSAEIILQIRANGSSGSVMANGDLTLYTTGTAAGSAYPIASGSTGGTTPVAVTADLTADTALAITAIWGTSNAANSIQGHQYSLESLN
ncbi:MAG TPA: hypothetical protein PKA61_07635 [Nitrospira sp.]|nr:hypothetical protein [Nitrospira sp.]